MEFAARPGIFHPPRTISTPPAVASLPLGTPVELELIFEGAG